MSLVMFVLYLFGIGAASLILSVGFALWRGLRPRYRADGADDSMQPAPMPHARRRA